MRSFSDPGRWMAITFSSDGLISSISSSAEQLTGYSAQELVGRPITQIMADRSVFEVPTMMQFAGDWGTWEGEIVYQDRSGKSLEGRASLSMLAGRGNAAAGFLLVSILRASKSGPLNRPSPEMSEVGSRLRALAHELNNPLAVMMGFSQLIMLNSSCNGKIRADMEKLFVEMQRVIEVVEKLHSYAISLQVEPQSRVAMND